MDFPSKEKKLHSPEKSLSSAQNDNKDALQLEYKMVVVAAVRQIISRPFTFRTSFRFIPIHQRKGVRRR